MKCDSADSGLCEGKMYRSRYKVVYRCEWHIKAWEVWAELPASLGSYSRKDFRVWLSHVEIQERVLRQDVPREDWIETDEEAEQGQGAYSVLAGGQGV